MGATEYAVKPFAPTELAARVRAALRRHELPEPPEHFVPGDLVVDYARRVVTPDGSVMRLTAIEGRTLAVLAANAGRETTYGAAAATGLGDGRRRRPAARAHRTGYLRRKLRDDADNPVCIHTEPRVEYRMAFPEAAQPEAPSTL